MDAPRRKKYTSAGVTNTSPAGENMRNYIAGNYCLHNPANFRDISFPNEKKRPWTIQELMQKIRKCLPNPKKPILELNRLNKLKKYGSKENDEDYRLTRSEGRESLMITCLMLAYNLELSTMTIRKDDYQFNNMTLSEMTNKFQSLSKYRTHRAIKKLVDCEWVKLTRQYEYKKNIYLGMASIKEITYKFFKAFGLAHKYDTSRHYKQKKLEKREYKKSKKQTMMQRFDKYLPRRETIFKKVTDGNKTLQVIAYQDVEAMRAELIKISVAASPAVDARMIESVIRKYTCNTLKKCLEYYRTKPPP